MERNNRHSRQPALVTSLPRKPDAAAPPVYRPAISTVTAPAAYRPNGAAPLQRKPGIGPQPPVYRPANAAVAPPAVYRPNVAAPVQPKQRIAAPPVYRPQPAVQQQQRARGATVAAGLPTPAQSRRLSPNLNHPATVRNPSATMPIQMRKPDGLYRVTKEANLRAKVDAEGNYKVKGKLPTGTAVLAIKAGSPKQSNFKAGWWTNEHTWVKLTDPATDYKDAAIMEQPSGWVEDGKLGEIEGSIQSSWKSGDKLYGSHEARDSLLKLAYKANEKVQADKYATVDLVHEALGKDADDQEIAAYRKGFVSHARSEKRVWGYDDKTRNLCKYGLAHYTADHKIHFMLDGLDATRVVPAKGGDTKTFTNSEIRAIMRQRMADLGLAGGKKQGINLQNIVFYLGHQPVPAPWDSKAPSAWHQAWKGYVKYRADKGKKKKEEQEEEDDDND